MQVDNRASVDGTAPSIRADRQGWHPRLDRRAFLSAGGAAAAGVLLSSVSAAAARSRLADRRVDPADFPWSRWAAENSIPGFAVVAVRHDRVLWTYAHGVRYLTPPGQFAQYLQPFSPRGPFDIDTIGNVASLSKTFTAAAMGILHDRGALDFDAPVNTYLPEFRLPAPAPADAITVRDLLRHTSGLPAVPQIRESGVLSMRDMADLEGYNAFNAGQVNGPYVEYSNTNYVLAGAILETICGERYRQYWPGERYQQFVQENILGPLGMGRSRSNFRQWEVDPNRAYPHMPMRGNVLVPVVYGGTLNAVGHKGRPREKIWGSYGGWFTTARDLGTWTRMYLGGGSVGATRIVSTQTLHALVTPEFPFQATITKTGHTQTWELLEDELGVSFQYGLGMVVSPVDRAGYDGMSVWTHRGSEEGSRATIMMFPDADLGVAVIQNCITGSEDLFSDAVCWAVADRYLAAQPRDWVSLFRSEADAIEPSPTLPPTSPAPPSMPLASYTGTFADNGLVGTCVISLEAGGLRYKVGQEEGSLSPWTGDSFRLLPDFYTADNGLYRPELASFTRAGSQLEIAGAGPFTRTAGPLQ